MCVHFTLENVRSAQAQTLKNQTQTHTHTNKNKNKNKKNKKKHITFVINGFMNNFLIP